MIKRYYRDWFVVKINFKDLDDNQAQIPQGASVEGCIFTDDTPWQDHFYIHSDRFKRPTLTAAVADHSLRPGRLRLKMKYWWDNEEVDEIESVTRVYDLGIDLTQDPVDGGSTDTQVNIPIFAATLDAATAKRITDIENKVSQFKPSSSTVKSQCVDRRIHKGLLNIRNNQGGVYRNEKRSVKISLGRMRVGDVKTFDLRPYFDEASKPIAAEPGCYGAELGHSVEYVWPMVTVTAVVENAAGFVQGNVFLYVADESPYVEIPKGGGKVRFISNEDAYARRLAEHDVPIEADFTIGLDGFRIAKSNYDLQRYRGRGVSYRKNHRRRRPKWRRCRANWLPTGIYRVRYAANRGYKGDWKYFIVFESRRTGRRIKWI